MGLHFSVVYKLLGQSKQCIGLNIYMFVGTLEKWLVEEYGSSEIQTYF